MFQAFASWLLFNCAVLGFFSRHVYKTVANNKIWFAGTSSRHWFWAQILIVGLIMKVTKVLPTTLFLTGTENMTLFRYYPVVQSK